MMTINLFVTHMIEYHIQLNGECGHKFLSQWKNKEDGQQNIIYGPWWTAPPVPTAPPGLYSNARPGFVGVEAAALFDVWRPAGHRFGVVGGWRREYWWYNDEGTNDANAGVWSRDNATSTIPFVGLCAEMAYPGWRSTFEFLTKRAWLTLRRRLRYTLTRRTLRKIHAFILFFHRVTLS